MPKSKTIKTRSGKIVHYSVGALIRKNGKYLLVDRKKPPFGFAGIAGHIEVNEDKDIALKREVKEESGLDVKKFKLLFKEKIDWNSCSKGVNSHFWYLYKCEVVGKVKENKMEVKSIGWYSIKDIQKLKLEKVWEYWFRKINVIKINYE